jgi:hypothetical protein
VTEQDFLEQYLASTAAQQNSPLAQKLRKPTVQPLAPGVQAAAPPQGQIGDQRWDDNFSAAKFNIDALSGENQGIDDQQALINSLRGRKHSTAIGGALGAAGDIAGAVLMKQNMDKQSILREKATDEMRKSRFRNSATNGLEVDPYRDL